MKQIPAVVLSQCFGSGHHRYPGGLTATDVWGAHSPAYRAQCQQRSDRHTALCQHHPNTSGHSSWVLPEMPWSVGYYCHLHCAWEETESSRGHVLSPRPRASLWHSRPRHRQPGCPVMPLLHHEAEPPKDSLGDENLTPWLSLIPLKDTGPRRS